MNHVKAALLLATVSLLGGCTGPKVVGQITARGDRAKFVYAQVGFMKFDQGIVECKAAANGDLSECKEKPLFFKDP